MFINCNAKPILLIGYEESSLTQEMLFLAQEVDPWVNSISPENFRKLENKNDYQYIVSFGLDLDERNEIINIVNNYDVPSFIHKTAYVTNQKSIGRGTCVGPFSVLMQSSKVGDHSIVETQCQISHYTSVGDNCILHAGTMIAGKCDIGNDVMLNFRSTVLNKISITSNTYIGGGSVVSKDITKPGFYVGNPARLVRSF